MTNASDDYLCFKLADLADDMKKDVLSYRRAFAAHLMCVSKAIHAIEFVQSGQNPEGSEREAIQNCINPTFMLRTLVIEADNLRNELKSILKRAKI